MSLAQKTADRGLGRFRVGGWEVMPAADSVSRDGRSERLDPLAMQALVYLASRAGEVVSRDDLERAVWRGGVAGYDAVDSTITELRRALGDDARSPTYIATVPKRGYRLIAAVSTETAGTAGRGGAPAVGLLPVTRADRADRRKVALMLLVLAAIAVVVWYLLRQLTPPPAPGQADIGSSAQPAPSLVVSPFDRPSGAVSQERFADRMTGVLVTGVSSITGLRVIASDTAFAGKDRRMPLQAMHADLGGGCVLEGSVRRHGDALRVNAQLVDAGTALPLSARS